MKLNRWRSVWRDLLVRRQNVVGINRRNVELIYPFNERRHFAIADDKLVAKEVLTRLGVPVPRLLGVANGLHEVGGLLARIEGEEHFVVKPAQSSGGQGLLVVGEQVAPGVWIKAGGGRVTLAQIRQHVANIVFGAFSKDRPDRAYVEERIQAHPVYQRLWQDGLSDLRIITLRGTPLMAMLRVPTAASGGVANLHQGGIGLAIDIETGRTVRASFRGRPIERHPDNGERLIGVEQPEWDKVLDTARRASRVPLAYLGTDIVVDRDGRTLVLELNARPGLEIQNVNGQGLGTRLMEVLG